MIADGSVAARDPAPKHAHAAVGAAERLQAVENGLAVMQHAGGGVQRERRVRDDARVMPAGARPRIHEEHVVGEDFAELQRVVGGRGVRRVVWVMAMSDMVSSRVGPDLGQYYCHLSLRACKCFFRPFRPNGKSRNRIASHARLPTYSYVPKGDHAGSEASTGVTTGVRCSPSRRWYKARATPRPSRLRGFRARTSARGRSARRSALHQPAIGEDDAHPSHRDASRRWRIGRVAGIRVKAIRSPRGDHTGVAYRPLPKLMRCGAAAAGAHDVDLLVAAAIGGEGDLRAVRADSRADVIDAGLVSRREVRLRRSMAMMSEPPSSATVMITRLPSGEKRGAKVMPGKSPSSSAGRMSRSNR